MKKKLNKSNSYARLKTSHLPCFGFCDYVALRVNPTNSYKVVELNFNEYREKQILYIQSLTTGVVFEMDIDSIVGIKLTKSIFKKNNWINDLYTLLPIDNNRYLKYYWHENRLQYIWNGIDEYENHSKVTDIIFQCGNIKYVHELQHALKLCGLYNLANNFKV